MSHPRPLHITRLESSALYQAYVRTLPALAVALLLAPFLPLLIPSAHAQTGERRWLDAEAAPADQKRVALIIGNTHYGGANSLKNPENDARAMAHTLQALGFDVLMCLDQTSEEMDNDIDDFGKKIAGARVALFYFSGHGAQVGGENYLIPVGFEGHSDSAIKYHAVNAGHVLDSMRDAHSRVNIVILDACRDNPFAPDTRSLTRGLAALNAPGGTIIAYATAPGQTAEDNSEGANGLYTQELLAQMKTPDQRIEDVFINTRNAVLEKSNNRQEPWEEGSLRERFFFKEPTGTAVNTVINTVRKSNHAPGELMAQVNTLLVHNNYQQVLTLAQAAIDANSGDVEALVARARAFEGIKDVSRATADVERALALNPGYAYAYTCRGNILLDRGDKVKALAEYNRAIALDPRLAMPFYKRGYIYFDQGDKVRALADYSKAIDLDPAYPIYYNSRGGIYNERGDHARALADYNKAIELDPEFAFPYYNRGSLYVSQNDNEKAMPDFDRYIALAPDDPDGYYSRGNLYYNQGDKARALADYDKTIELDPKNSNAYLNRGAVYYMQGDRESALADYNKAIELNPKNAIAYCNRGALYEDKGGVDFAKAMPDYSKAIELDPKYVDAYNKRGSLYFVNNEYDKAIPDYTKAIAADPKSPLAYYHRGHIYREQGKKSLALSDFKHYIEYENRKDSDTRSQLDDAETYVYGHPTTR